MLLSTGDIVNRDTCPKEAGLPQLFMQLANAKKILSETTLSPDETTFLRQSCLYANSRDVETHGILEVRLNFLRREVVSKVQAIATQITQLTFYKSNYLAVMTELEKRE